MIIMELTILMPCLNEAETLATCIQKAKNFLHQEKIEGEILISDNGSSDGSQHIAEQYGARLIHATTKGYGAALINGIQEAQGRYIIMGDADDSYDFTELKPFLDKLKEGYDLVMGNRFQGGIKPGAMPFLNRYLGNPVLSFLGRKFFKSPIGDFHCGLRGFSKEAIAKINLKAPGMEFASEMVVKASIGQLKIAEVATTLSKDGRSRPPHLRKWRDGWRHLRLLLLFSPSWMFLYPGLLFSLVGFTLMSILAITPITIGNLRLDIHTMLFSSMFFIVGVQAILFSLCSNVIAKAGLHINHNKRLQLVLKKFTLERGIILGMIFVLLGVVTSFVSLKIWANFHFGELIPALTMRFAILAVTLLIVGLQIIFSSFFMNLINNLNMTRQDLCSM